MQSVLHIKLIKLEVIYRPEHCMYSKELGFLSCMGKYNFHFTVEDNLNQIGLTSFMNVSLIKNAVCSSAYIFLIPQLPFSQVKDLNSDG